jgi:hypothetical protein
VSRLAEDGIGSVALHPAYPSAKHTVSKENTVQQQQEGDD